MKNDPTPATTPDLLLLRSATFARGQSLRMTLVREWDAALKKVCFIGHNPSTADHQVDDPTVRRWMHFARAWGYGGFVAVNLYPFRAADVRECWRWADWEANGPDWYARDDHHHNLEVVSREAKQAGIVVACWGAIAKDQDWVDEILEEIMDGAEPWPSIHAFGFTASGSPIHPMARGRLRIPDSATPIMWKRNNNEERATHAA